MKLVRLECIQINALITDHGNLKMPYTPNHFVKVTLFLLKKIEFLFLYNVAIRNMTIVSGDALCIFSGYETRKCA